MNQWKIYNRLFLMIILMLIGSLESFAHTINYALEKAPAGEVIGYYLKLGFRHILPDGLDHILFVVGLCLLTNNLRSILWQATAFTVAHSITLLLSMKNIIIAPPAIVESVIALSILFIAIENILLQKVKTSRIALVFIFGLIHGLGFASSLNEIGLPRDRFITSIISFNLGVEAGQIFVIAGVMTLLFLPFKKKEWYRKIIVIPLSLLIGGVALYWTVERMV